jgi:hypothetical protein
MFFQRAIHLVNERGKVGAITNRTWLGLPTFEALRTQIFGRFGYIEVAADLGSFVLDAQVETAASIIGRDIPRNRKAVWIRLLKTKAKSETLLQAIGMAREGQRHRATFFASQEDFSSLPTTVYGYWMSDSLRRLYRSENSVGVSIAEVKQGTATADDFRFLRLAWEVPPRGIGLERDWARFAKGGEYRNFFDDIHLVVKWADGGRELAAFPSARFQNPDFCGSPGVTWPRRTTSPFGPRVFPEGCAFGDKGPVAFPKEGRSAYVLLGVLASRPIKLLLAVRLGAGDDAPGSASKSYEVGLIRDLPFPSLSKEQARALAATTARCVALVRSSAIEDEETAAYFVYPTLSEVKKKGSIRSTVSACIERREERFLELCSLTSGIDRVVSEALGFEESDNAVMWEELEPPLTAYDATREPDTKLFEQAYMTKDAISGEALPGGIEAEADVRVLTRRKQQVAVRSEEAICRLFEVTPETFVRTRRHLSILREQDLTESVGSLVNFAVGCAFGRWDIRYATGEMPAPELSDPFVPLPNCLPGQLQNEQGSVLSKEDVCRLEATGQWHYPLNLPWKWHPRGRPRRLPGLRGARPPTCYKSFGASGGTPSSARYARSCA